MQLETNERQNRPGLCKVFFKDHWASGRKEAMTCRRYRGETVLWQRAYGKRLTALQLQVALQRGKRCG